MPKVNIKSIKISWVLLALVVLLIVLTIVYKTKFIQPITYVSINAEQDKSCNLREKECPKKLANGGMVIFSIEPKDIPMLKPLTLNIKLKGVSSSKIEIDFMQKDKRFSLGYNRPELIKVSDTEFKGTAFLSLCATKEMNWEAKVILQTEQGVQTAVYHFLTYR